MNRTVFACILLAAASALAAQQAGQSDPYQGTSNPPPDDTIQTMTPQAPEAQAPKPADPVAQPAATPISQPSETKPSPSQPAVSEPASANEPASDAADGTDDGIVQVAPDSSAQPALNSRSADPDGDIVHPASPRPGQLGEGTIIRTRLLERLSTVESATGDKFRTQVASDVIQDGKVLIPAGSEIDGTLSEVSSGHLGGHGSMRLQPETVTLPDGSRYKLYAQVSATPGTRTRLNSEGVISPGSQLKKDSIEYGAATGAGVVTGAALAGGPGALAGGIVGAGVITVHLLVSHPQATLESGTALVFSLTEPLDLVPAGQSGE
jgi:hypothetical protein